MNNNEERGQLRSRDSFIREPLRTPVKTYRRPRRSSDHVVRHRDFHLWVEDNDGSDLFSKDASFYPRAPLQTQKIPCSMLEAIPEPFRPAIECE